VKPSEHITQNVRLLQQFIAHVHMALYYHAMQNSDRKNGSNRERNKRTPHSLKNWHFQQARSTSSNSRLATTTNSTHSEF